MSEELNATPAVDIEGIVRRTVEEFLRAEKSQREPAEMNELAEERERRSELERRLNELVEDNKKARAAAAEAERQSAIRAELQRLGVQKVELAYRAVKDDIVRGEDGRLYARVEGGETGMAEYLAGFVHANPEFLPARIPGGSGTTPGARASGGGGADLDRIKPGMSREERERVRQEIARITSETLRGY